jgi:hypothetical protein
MLVGIPDAVLEVGASDDAQVSVLRRKPLEAPATTVGARDLDEVPGPVVVLLQLPPLVVQSPS